MSKEHSFVKIDPQILIYEGSLDTQLIVVNILTYFRGYYIVTMPECNCVTVSDCYSVTVPGSDSVSVLQCQSIRVPECSRQTDKQSVPVFQCQSVPDKQGVNKQSLLCLHHRGKAGS